MDQLTEFLPVAVSRIVFYYENNARGHDNALVWAGQAFVYGLEGIQRPAAPKYSSRSESEFA